MPFCTNCGKENSEESQFCISCGFKLSPISDLGDNKQPSVQPQVTRGASPRPVFPKPSKTALKALVAITAVGLVLMLSWVFVYGMGGIGGISQSIQQALPPDVEVTSKNSREGYNGLDYTMWIDTSVHNSGGGGTVTVWARIIQGSNEWTKSQSMHLNADESRDLTFEFREISFWTTSSSYYSVWVTS